MKNTTEQKLASIEIRLNALEKKVDRIADIVIQLQKASKLYATVILKMAGKYGK